jgi:hypothetical protein
MKSCSAGGIFGLLAIQILKNQADMAIISRRVS